MMDYCIILYIHIFHEMSSSSSSISKDDIIVITLLISSSTTVVSMKWREEGNKLMSEFSTKHLFV